MFDNKTIIQKTIKFVTQLLEKNSDGHDIFHIKRVVNNAQLLAKKEGGNIFLIEMSAWLHDVGDYKLHNGEEKHAEIIPAFLQSMFIDNQMIEEILTIISSVSFKGGFNEFPLSLEAKIVQDADRLDALGAIGIARAFAYGGSKNRLLFDPNQKVEIHTDFFSYKNSNAPTLNHFYEKLLKLKDLMHTQTAKQMAKERHRFMEGYLIEFYKEWGGVE